jgi:hypothetical protein
MLFRCGKHTVTINADARFEVESGIKRGFLVAAVGFEEPRETALLHAFSENGDVQNDVIGVIGVQNGLQDVGAAWAHLSPEQQSQRLTIVASQSESPKLGSPVRAAVEPAVID